MSSLSLLFYCLMILFFFCNIYICRTFNATFICDIYICITSTATFICDGLFFIVNIKIMMYINKLIYVLSSVLFCLLEKLFYSALCLAMLIPVHSWMLSNHLYHSYSMLFPSRMILILLHLLLCQKYFNCLVLTFFSFFFLSVLITSVLVFFSVSEMHFIYILIC